MALNLKQISLGMGALLAMSAVGLVACGQRSLYGSLGAGGLEVVGGSHAADSAAEGDLALSDETLHFVPSTGSLKVANSEGRWVVEVEKVAQYSHSRTLIGYVTRDGLGRIHDADGVIIYQVPDMRQVVVSDSFAAFVMKNGWGEIRDVKGTILASSFNIAEVQASVELAAYRTRAGELVVVDRAGRVLFSRKNITSFQLTRSTLRFVENNKVQTIQYDV